MMRVGPTIGDYYRNAVEGARKEIETTPDDRVLGLNEDEWIAYLIKRWGMVEIVIEPPGTEVTMVEADREVRQRGYNIYTDRHDGESFRTTVVRLQVPVEPTDTIAAIWKNGACPNTYSMSHSYPPFEYDAARGIFTHEVPPDEESVKRGLQFVRHNVQRYNDSIKSENVQFPQEIARLVSDKRARVIKKIGSLDGLAAAVGIKLVKKADVSNVIPTAPRIRQALSPLMPPQSRPKTRPVLESEKLTAILDIIDKSGRQFERTPQTFRELTEEGLRDVVLSSLNAVFDGGATGESFRGEGKVDIHLVIAQGGDVLVVELKFWGGPETLKEVIGQLRGRLSWRDSYGVAVILSKNTSFTDVCTNIRATLPTCDGFVAGSMKQVAENHTLARFSIPSDDAKQATIVVLAYNLYTPNQGKRTVRSST
jgi:hypothetical protein